MTPKNIVYALMALTCFTPLAAHAQVGSVTQELEVAPFDSCSTSQKSAARAAEKLAIYITQDAIIDPLLDYRDSSGNPHWIIQRFFAGHRTWIPWTAEELKSRLHDIHDRMVEGDVQIKCRDCDGNAKVFPLFTDRITLCDAYFDNGPAYQASVFVHELSHELFWTNDEIYGTPPSSPWSESSRKNGYPGLVDYDDPFETAEPYEAVVHSLIGEHFDTLFREVYGVPISAHRFLDEVSRVQDGGDYQEELRFARSLLADIADGAVASHDDIDLVREHLLALGAGPTRAVFEASYLYDPLATEPSLHAVRAYLSEFGVSEGFARALFKGQFAAKLVALQI